MLLHSAEKEIDEDAVSAVLTAAGVDADGGRVKALVASLGSVSTSVRPWLPPWLLRLLRPRLPPLAAVAEKRLRLRKRLQRKSLRKRAGASRASARSSASPAGKKRLDAKALWARA